MQPLLWRPFGWCRLVVDVAGVASRDSGAKAGGLTKALLPVGPMSEAQYLVRRSSVPACRSSQAAETGAGQGTA